MHHHETATSRRDFLARAGGGLGIVALAALMDESDAAAPPVCNNNPIRARKPHFPATAKSVIWLFMDGGPSHIETFDPKPALVKPYDGRHPA